MLFGRAHFGSHPISRASASEFSIGAFVTIVYTVAARQPGPGWSAKLSKSLAMIRCGVWFQRFPKDFFSLVASNFIGQTPHCIP
jgi:hypothetical protein